MFLTTSDYNAVCDPYELQQITASDSTLRQQAEAAALQLIASYTRNRYDMDTEFAKTGDSRDPMLVNVAVNVALWFLVHRLPQQMGTDRRDQLYDEAVRWLKDVQASRATPDWARYVSADGEEGFPGFKVLHIPSKGLQYPEREFRCR